MSWTAAGELKEGMDTLDAGVADATDSVVAAGAEACDDVASAAREVAEATNSVAATRPRSKIINIALPKPEMRIWCFGCSGRSFSLSSSKTQLEVRSLLSDSLRMPICALEVKEEEGVVVVSRRCFDAKVCTDEDVFKGPEIDCYDCGDGPAGSISTVAHEDDYTCRSCGNCMPFCSRCMRTNGLEIHCALCLGQDWNTNYDTEGLRRHWALLDVGGREWCRNIGLLHENDDES